MGFDVSAQPNGEFDFLDSPALIDTEQVKATKDSQNIAWFKDLSKFIFWFVLSMNISLYSRDCDDKTATWIFLIVPKAIATIAAYSKKDDRSAKGEAIAIWLLMRQIGQPSSLNSRN